MAPYSARAAALSAATSLSLLLLPAAAQPDSKTGSGPGYTFFCIGNDCSAQLPVTPTPGYVIMGGSTDVDDAFLWQIERAAGGDFVILRASGSDAYNPYVWELSAGKLNSITTIILSDARGASQPFVVAAVAGADAIFFAGGDQTLYVEYIQSQSPLAAALQRRSLVATVGGTSAGGDYLSHFVFAPPTDAPSIESPAAMRDPYTYGMAFANSTFYLPGFATGGPGVRGFVADTHFVARDRMGRGLAFLARLVEDGAVSVQGGGCAYLVAANEKTAWLVETNGSAVVVGSAATSAAFVCSLCEAPGTCASGQRLTAGPYDCERLEVGVDTYSFAIWAGSGTRYQLSVTAGVLVGEPYGPA